jgi:hypothetical protein
MQALTFVEMDYEEWIEKYKPIKNDFEDGPRNYETYGEDFEAVKKAGPRYVWTWLDGGDYSIICNGIGWVNRLVYHICEVPWEEGKEIQIDMYQPDDCEESGHEFEMIKRYDGKEYDCCKHCGEDRESVEQYA